MMTTRIALVRLGSARSLTRLEPEGPFAEIGINKTRNPV